MGPADNFSRSPDVDNIRHHYQCRLLHLYDALRNGHITRQEHDDEKYRLEQLCELEVGNHGHK